MSARDVVRAWARWIAWPLWKRLWIRFDLRMVPFDQRIKELKRSLENLSSDLEEVSMRPARLVVGDPATARLDAFDTAWRQHLPALLATTTRAAAAADLTEGLLRRIQLLEARQEQTKAEYGALARAIGPGGTPADGAVALRPLDRLAGGADLRLLFLGPGALPRASYVTVSTVEAPGIDILSSGTGLPFAPGQVTEILADRFLETLDPGHWYRAVLPHWRSLLRAGGSLHLRLPDPDALLREIAAGKRTPEALRDTLADGGAILLHWPEALRNTLEAGGFRLAEPAQGGHEQEADNGLPMTDVIAVRT